MVEFGASTPCYLFYELEMFDLMFDLIFDRIYLHKVEQFIIILEWYQNYKIFLKNRFELHELWELQNKCIFCANLSAYTEWLCNKWDCTLIFYAIVCDTRSWMYYKWCIADDHLFVVSKVNFIVIMLNKC